MKRLAWPAVGLILAFGCTGAETRPASVVSLDEFTITLDGEMVSSGTELIVRNDGEFGHTLVVSDDGGTVVAASELVAPGQSVAMTADWPEGTYHFTCRIVIRPQPDRLIDHYAEGMLQEVDVRG